jgi:hypothetical protein
MVRLIRVFVDVAVAAPLAAVSLLVYWVDQRGLLRQSSSEDHQERQDPPSPEHGPPKLKLTLTPSQLDELDLIATVEDPDRHEVPWAQAPLHFDPEVWRRAAFGGLGVTTYLKESFQINGGTMITAPQPA